MKVLGVVGSSRKNGNTSRLVQETLEATGKEGVETQLIFLGDYSIKDCIGCEGCKDSYKCVTNDDMQKIYPLLWEADGIILGSPTYFYNISAAMKAFIDRCYCFSTFADEDRSCWTSINEVLGVKYAVVIAVCEQKDERDMGSTVEAMSKPLESLGYRVIDTVKAFNAFKAGEVSANDAALMHSRKAGERLARMMRLKKDVEARIKGKVKKQG